MKESKLQVRWVALLAATVLALYVCWLLVLPFLDVLAWAAMLVIIFYPIHKRIVARLGSPGWGAMVSCLLVIVIIVAPLTLITFAVVREATDVVQKLQANAGDLLDPDSPVTGPALRWIGQYVDIERLRSGPYLAERLQSLSEAIAGRTLGFVGGLVGVVVQIFFIVFTMYYFFRDGDRILDTLLEALPLETIQSREISARTHDVISASVYGVLVIAGIQGALGGLAFWALGLPSPLLWGVVMVLLSLIPMVGAFVVWVPAAIYLALTGDWGKALALTVWGTLVIGTADNFLRPKLVGEKTRLHELLIFFSVLGGLQVFGVLGIVLGPVAVAVTLALLDVLRHADRPPTAILQEPTLAEEQEALRAVPAE
jgi:predicted PurR-regulated permease PerM